MWYAAAGKAPKFNANGGGNLGETMIFGRVAGRNAALRAKGEFESATEPAVLVDEEEAAK